MKSKKKLLFFFLLYVILFPVKVFAGDGTLNLTGDSKVNSGSSFSVDIVASITSGSLTSSGGEIVTDGDCISFVSIDKAAANYVANRKFGYLGGQGGTFTLAKVNLKAKDSACKGYVQIKNGADLTFNDNSTIKLNTRQKDIQVIKLSTNNNLSSLSVNNGSLSPGFNANTTNYTVNVGENVSSITINGGAEDSSAKVSGTGNKNLNYGANKFTITVTAENGSKKTYTINVHRADNRSSNSNLKTIKISNADLSPGFNENTTDYKVTVPFSVERLNIDAIASDGKSKVNVNNKDLVAEETTTITITVTAENGSQKVYTIEATRGKDPNKVLNTDNLLTNLTPSVGILSPSFDAHKNNYAIYLPYESESISFDYELSDKRYGTVEVSGPEKLEPNSANLYTIKVKAEDESINTYSINVFRGKNMEINEDSSIYLNSLTLTNGKLKENFDSKKFHYYYTKKKDFSYTYEKETEDSTVKVFEDNNIYIVVENSKGDIGVYHLEIKKANIPFIIVTGITVLLGGFLVYDKLLKKKSIKYNY